jgi:hypothetical protein
MKDTIILANTDSLDIEKLDKIVEPYFITSIAENGTSPTTLSDTNLEEAACDVAISTSQQNDHYVVASRGRAIGDEDENTFQWRQAIAIARNGELIFSTEVGSDMTSRENVEEKEYYDQAWQRLKRMFDWFVRGE